MTNVRWLIGSSLVGALLLGLSPPAWAGAWTVPSRRWYVEYFYRYFGSKKEFDQDGEDRRRAKTATFRDIRNELKFEYGVTDWWNILWSVPYISSHYRDDGTDLLRTGIGDIYVRTKFRILNQPVIAETPFVSSVQFSWKIPSAYDPIENPIGDGQFDFESRLMLSQAWLFGGEDVEARSPSAGTPQAPQMDRQTAEEEALIQAEMMERGLWAYAAGNSAEAAQWFAAIVARHPDHYEAHRLLEEIATNDLTQVILASAEHIEAVGDTETRPMKVVFINLEGAFTARNEDPANEFPLLAEAGFTPFKRLMVIGSIESVVSVNSTNEAIENFAKWGVRGIFNVWGDGFATVFKTGGPTVNFEVGYNDIFAGRNTADAFEVFGKVGVFF